MCLEGEVQTMAPVVLETVAVWILARASPSLLSRLPRPACTPSVRAKVIVQYY